MLSDVIEHGLLRNPRSTWSFLAQKVIVVSKWGRFQQTTYDKPQYFVVLPT